MEDHIGTEKALQSALEKACFKSVQILEEEKIFLHKTGQEWWESLWIHATRSKLETLSTDQLLELNQKLVKKADALNLDEGIPESIEVFYGIGKK